MNYIKNFVYSIFFALLLVTQVGAAKTITINSNHYTDKHLDAVGAVFNIEGSNASVGTGTYIGNKRILTAGHIFYDLLPKSVPQKSGPVTINISDKRVFWTNQQELDFSFLQSAVYHASSITVDASFINNLKADIHNPNQSDVKCDIAILTLDQPVENVSAILLPDDHPVIPDEGLLVGYGRGGQVLHNKHARAQALHGVQDMGDWAIFMSNLTEDMKYNPLHLGADQQDVKLEMLLGKDTLGIEDTQITRATQGDSGGPLLMATEDGGIHVIGIMSANSEIFNAFASLVVKTPAGLFRSPSLDALIRAATQ